MKKYVTFKAETVDVNFTAVNAADMLKTKNLGFKKCPDEMFVGRNIELLTGLKRRKFNCMTIDFDSLQFQG